MHPSDRPTEEDGLVRVWLDVANVMGARPDGWWRDRAGAASRLLAAVAACPADTATWAAALGASTPPDGGPSDPLEILAVLEGAACAASDPADHTAGGIPMRVVRATGSADDAIAAECAAGDVVVTADRGLRARVHDRGAATVGPTAVYGLLDR